jgi:ubiquinone/menaquinone biosynthesis C-methylase UbiE
MIHSYGAAYRRAVARQVALRGEEGYVASVGGMFEEMGALQRALVDAAGLPADGVLIDIGCGAGRLASAMRDRVKLTYIGIDVSPALLKHARKLAARDDWRFERVRSALIPASDAAADVVTMFSVATHLPIKETQAYFRDGARVLKSGGAFIVSFLDPEVEAYRQMIRPPLVEAIVTKLFWAPNVANTIEEIRGASAAAGLAVERIESPSPLGQSVAVLRKP